MTYWRHVRWGVEIGGARVFVIVILMHITFAVHSRLHRNSTDLKDHANMLIRLTRVGECLTISSKGRRKYAACYDPTITLTCRVIRAEKLAFRVADEVAFDRTMHVFH